MRKRCLWGIRRFQMRWLMHLAFLAAFLVGGLAACSRNSSPVDDNLFLGTLGFNEPLGILVSLAQPVDGQGNLGNSGDAALIAFFRQAGFVSAVPNTKGAPWWTFNASAGSLNDNQLRVDVGNRVIVGRSDQTRWTEGPIEYYAETIHYAVKLVDKIQATANAAPITGTLRLVLRKDPAIGQWQVFNAPDRGTQWSQNDLAIVSDLVAQVGNGFLSDLNQQIQSAQISAFDQIEKYLADQGILAKSPEDANVLASTKSGLLFYKGALFPLSQNITIDSLEVYCGNLKAGNHHWRLPSEAELDTVMRSDVPNSFGIVDTPDARLWGRFTGANNQAIMVVTNSRTSNSLYLGSYIDYLNVFNGDQFVNKYQKNAIDLINNYGTIGLTDHYGNQGQIQAICVSNSSAPVSTNAKTRSLASLPSFPKSTMYRDAREKLTKLGWRPVTLPDADKCMKGDIRCENFPEMWHCAGTGNATCRFTWRRNDLLIQVMGIGEGDQPVDSVVLCESGSCQL